MSINVLDQMTINKIAAGEVIERPSSVVKELVENAIDARATAITVEIKDGGISFIRITDNGCGFEKEDIPVAFLRHSTSKIKSVEDLITVSSLGFRGEALSSISSIAQVELITKTHGDLMGTRYSIEGGVEKANEAIGCPDGTTFIIRNMFFNTPARRKFLKSPVTEAGYIADLIEKLALSHPDISFRFINNNQNKLHTSGNGNIKDIIYHIFGRDISANIIPVTFSSEILSISGFIGKPVVTRGNRNFENYYINGRFIKNKVVNKAIEDAYKPFLMQHCYPFTVLHIKIDSDRLDVNVHPTKMELRFNCGEDVYNHVYDALTKALTHKEFIPDVKIDEPKEEKTPKKAEKISIPEPFEVKRMEMVNEKVSYMEPINELGEIKETKELNVPIAVKEAVPTETTIQQNHVEQPVIAPKQMTLFEEKLLDEKSVIKHRIIGQLFKTYWIIEFEDKMYIIDQHAAHEKVLYERIMKKYQDSKIDSQNLMPPVIVTLSNNEEAVYKENEVYFEKLGITLEPFGGREYALTTVPLELYGLGEKEVFLEILNELSEGSYKTITSISDRMATIACKAAVKGNNTLSEKEARELINELLTLENPYNCPHGRPTIISMSQYEIERKFKRII